MMKLVLKLVVQLKLSKIGVINLFICKSKFLEIWYWDFDNIEKILEKESGLVA